MADELSIDKGLVGEIGEILKDDRHVIDSELSELDMVEGERYIEVIQLNSDGQSRIGIENAISYARNREAERHIEEIRELALNKGIDADKLAQAKYNQPINLLSYQQYMALKEELGQ